MGSGSFNLRIKHGYVIPLSHQHSSQQGKEIAPKGAHLLSPSICAAKIKCHKLDSLYSKNPTEFISLRFEAWTCNIRAPAWLHSDEAIFLVQGQCLLCPHTLEGQGISSSSLASRVKPRRYQSGQQVSQHKHLCRNAFGSRIDSL